ncbi:MAG: carboxypeptidase CpsA [Conexivisphaerales archaeon]
MSLAVFEEEVRKVEPRIIEIRREIHSNPELSYKELQTSKLVADELRKMGIEVKTGVGGTGVLGILKGTKEGKVVALRADMDALPVEEQVNIPFRSKNKGVMHACGHDTHVAMLLGAAMLLSNHRDELSGVVKFIFQPAEEHGGRGGALPMIEAGVMDNPKVDYVFGLHITSDYPSGTFAVRGGAMMAAPDSFKIRVIGKGGHGSQPHKTVDPIYISAQIINALQGVSGRMVDQTRPLVISVCHIESGTKENIIPDEAFLEGTIRTLDEQTRKSVKRRVRKVVEGICRTYGAKCELSYEEDAYPVTVNDVKATERLAKLLRKIKGAKVVQAEPSLGGEDFSRFLQKAKGSFYWLGTYNPEKECIYPNHSSKFKVDEDVLKMGSVSLALAAMEFSKTG